MKWFLVGVKISLSLLPLLFASGCGEHPSKVKRDWSGFTVPQEAEPEIADAPKWETPKYDEELTAANLRLAEMDRRLAELKEHLAAEKKGGFTGCKFYTTTDCLPCAKLEAALKKAGWTVGDSAKFHFWKIVTTDKKAHPYVPHLVYFLNGKVIPGEIVGYDGSAKSLAEIIAKHPLAHKGKPEAWNAAVEIGQAFASVEQEVFPPPAPPSEDDSPVQVGCSAPASVPASTDCGGFPSFGCGAPQYGCSAPALSYGCGAPQSYSYAMPQSYSMPTYSYQPNFYGVRAGRFCIGGACW